MEKHFLEQYQVHKKKEAINATKRKEARTGESNLMNNSQERIKAYTERLEEIFFNPDEERGEERSKIFKEKFLYPDVLVQQDNFPESHFDFQKEDIYKRTGQKVEFNEEDRGQEMHKVIEEQRVSLDSWIDYLTGEDCYYPSDIKLFAMQGFLKLGLLDSSKDNYKFARRSKNTTIPFAEIDREALSIVLGALEAKHHKGDTGGYKEELLELIDNGNSFGGMYSYVMGDIDKNIDKEKLLPITDGEWRTFKQGSDPKLLVKSIEGKRSNLCIANIGSASGYLEKGNMDVYYSNNHGGEAVIPRIAIASTKEGVYEIRGTFNKNEDVDPFISETDILSEKVSDYQNGEEYLVADKDVKQLNSIHEKCFKINRKTRERISLNPELTKEDLRFLYEIDKKIESFGYEKHPRIEEIIEGRDIKKDISQITSYVEEEISLTKEEALSGGIKYHHGNLNLNSLQTAEGVTLPKTVGKGLYLKGLQKVEKNILREKYPNWNII